MNQEIENLISKREVGHEGIDELWWITSDKGAFKWPLRDWLEGKEFFLKYVKKFDLIVQAGGNCGMYARFYSNYFKTIYSFEPELANFTCLTRNCQGEQYHLFNAALGQTNSKCSLINPRSPKNVGAYRVHENLAGQIDMVTIDECELNDCDLIHLDVEGFEPYALKGALNTIQKFKPVIILEAGHGREVILPLGYKEVMKLKMDWIFIHE